MLAIFNPIRGVIATENFKAPRLINEFILHWIIIIIAIGQP